MLVSAIFVPLPPEAEDPLSLASAPLFIVSLAVWDIVRVWSFWEGENRGEWALGSGDEWVSAWAQGSTTHVYLLPAPTSHPSPPLQSEHTFPQAGQESQAPKLPQCSHLRKSGWWRRVNLLSATAPRASPFIPWQGAYSRAWCTKGSAAVIMATSPVCHPPFGCQLTTSPVTVSSL